MCTLEKAGTSKRAVTEVFLLCHNYCTILPLARPGQLLLCGNPWNVVYGVWDILLIGPVGEGRLKVTQVGLSLTFEE